VDTQPRCGTAIGFLVLVKVLRCRCLGGRLAVMRGCKAEELEQTALRRFSALAPRWVDYSAFGLPF